MWKSVSLHCFPSLIPSTIEIISLYIAWIKIYVSSIAIMDHCVHLKLGSLPIILIFYKSSLS